MLNILLHVALPAIVEIGLNPHPIVAVDGSFCRLQRSLASVGLVLVLLQLARHQAELAHRHAG